jgi:hypothetical protein
LRDPEERLDHQDSQERRESWEYRDLPATLVLRERKGIRDRRAKTAIREKKETG